jgi:uncharacterized protein (UPF0248 family)/Asp/Glu/hydantoin racemase
MAVTFVALIAMLSLIRNSPTMVRAFTHNTRNYRFSRPTVLRRFATDFSSDQTVGQTPEPMENVYQDWSIDQDQMLWENRKESPVTLAALLGRGLRGVESRMSKLKDVNSSAYQRLFADQKPNTKDDIDMKEKQKLVPASEVLRRIKWDALLSTKDFSILHYDRVEDKVVESPYDAPNNSISGKETEFVKALPEHRIVGIKYKERIVWDRERRVDHVFSNEGIEQVMVNYDEWKRKRDDIELCNKERQAQVSDRLQIILGPELFGQMKKLSSSLKSSATEKTTSTKIEVENYVQACLNIFQQVRDNPSASLDRSLIPTSDYEALDSLSELVALLPNSFLRPMILSEVSLVMERAKGKKINVVASQRELPVLLDEDLTETFIRGSGPGGQKINKTSNRVLLVHEPTQIRVECQDTRSLQQNRKIAKKRLQLKLDDYLNGSQSRGSLAAEKASTKKSKTKARSRARQRQKKEAGGQTNVPSFEEEEEF